jgi:nucleoside-diphosphate-sugar epimerase
VVLFRHSTALYWQDWYSVAKIVAEQEAWEYADKNGLSVVTLCPPYVFGPLLQPTVNASSKILIYIIKGFLVSAIIFCIFITMIMTSFLIFYF